MGLVKIASLRESDLLGRTFLSHRAAIRQGTDHSIAVPTDQPTTTNATNSTANLMSTTQGTRRDLALDFTKGILVLLMVLYHWLNYFVSPYGVGYRYIRFITPSFVFLAGFLVTNLLVSRRDPNAPSLSRRLFVRGIKLLIIFTVLNIAVASIEPARPSGRLPGLDTFIEALPESYMTGRHTAFFVLMPISYTLILAALLYKFRDLFRVQFLATAIVLFAIASGLVLWGIESPVLQLFGAGLLGLAVGSALGERLLVLQRGWSLLVLTYVLHLAALTIWGVPYPLQLVSVCVNLALLYFLGSRIRPGASIGKLTSLLGQYTLLGYIGQIAVLQLLFVTAREVDFGSAESAVALAATLLFTVGGIAIVDHLRRRSRLVDSVYRLMFA